MTMPPSALRAGRIAAALLPAAVALTLSLGTPPARAADPAPLQTVAAVDINKYMGRWYQIAFYPNRFQKQCTGDVTADYRLLHYGRIEVINQCKTAEGADKVVGEARLQQRRFLGIPVSEPLSTARLEVRFAPAIISWFPGVWAPYWVIQLADDYRYAVVSEPSREYLWILARTPSISGQDYAAIKTRLSAQGFDVNKLVELPQSTAP